MTAAIVLNLVFAVTVVVGVTSLMIWGVISDNWTMPLPRRPRRHLAGSPRIAVPYATA